MIVSHSTQKTACGRIIFFVSLRLGLSFFFFILCNLFLGREAPLYFRSGCSSLPKPHPPHQHCGFIVASLRLVAALRAANFSAQFKTGPLCLWSICRLYSAVFADGKLTYFPLAKFYFDLPPKMTQFTQGTRKDREH